METNFFTQIGELLTEGSDITLTIKKQGDKMAVGVRVNNSILPDGHKLKDLPAIVITHPSEELDTGFFETIQEPVKATNEAYDAVTPYLKTLAEKSKSTAAEKPKAKPAPKKDDTKEKQKAVSKAIADGLKVIKLMGNHEAVGRKEKGVEALKNLASVIKDLESMPADVKAAYSMVVDDIQKEVNAINIHPIMEEVEAAMKLNNFQKVGKGLKRIYDIEPKHEAAKEVQSKLDNMLGESIVSTLIK